MNRIKTLLLASSASTLMLAAAGAAMAQDAPAAQDPADAEVEEIVVVGSQIRGASTTAALPVLNIDQDQIDSGRYTSLFVSVIAEGTIARIEGEEWLAAFDALCCKYSADRPLAERQAKVSACTKAIGLKLTISSMTGKEAKELAGVSYP